MSGPSQHSEPPAAALSEVAARAQTLGLEPPDVPKVLEARVLVESAAVVARLPSLLREPRGDGHRVLVIPGFTTDDRAMWPLRRYLRSLGYNAIGWGLGTNRGEPERDTARLLESLDWGPPTSIVGWSLGGNIGRLIARERPLRRLITLGSPVEGGVRYTIAGRRLEAEGVDVHGIEARAHALNTEGLDVPLTVVYSRSDAIVAWKAALDRHNAHAEHHCVMSSHAGLIVHPQVWRIVARDLAR